jgi:hypothetical protein
VTPRRLREDAIAEALSSRNTRHAGALEGKQLRGWTPAPQALAEAVQRSSLEARSWLAYKLILARTSVACFDPRQ